MPGAFGAVPIDEVTSVCSRPNLLLAHSKPSSRGGADPSPPIPSTGNRRRMAHALPTPPGAVLLTGRKLDAVGRSDDPGARSRESIQPPNSLLSQPKKPPPP